MTIDVDVILRDDITQGDSGSGAHKPVKSQLRQYLKALGRAAASNTVHVATKTELDAITGTTDDQGGMVWGDSTAANNGVYRWDANAGPAAWEKIAGLPHTAAVLTNIGGTANAITADTETGVDPAEVKILVLPDPPGTTTSTTVTLALNGGSAESVKAASGSNLAIGDIIDGVGTLFFRSGSEWRQLVSSRGHDTLDYQGVWDSGTPYTQGQFVTSGSVFYYLDAASSTNEDPASGAPWVKVFDLGSLTVIATGATEARTQSERAADRWSVLDFGTVDLTGAVSAQTVVAAAVAAANTAGAELYWPAGTYLTTASVPNLHSVRHVGPGVVKRGSDLFYPDPDPGVTNTFYISTSGEPGADGLSASEPMPDLISARDAHENYGPFLKGLWRVVCAAGTYTGANNRNVAWTSFKSEEPITIVGPDVSGHPNAPTAIFDGEDASGSYGIQFSEGTKGRIEDILFKDMAVFGANAVFVSQLDTLNVHTDNCLTGLRATFQSDLQVIGGVIDGKSRASSTGIMEILGVSHRVGVTGDDPDTTGPLIKNCVTGALVAENCSGHYNAVFEDNGTGVRVDANARVNFDSSEFKRHTTAAIRGTANAIIHGLTGVNMYTGTSDANASNVILENGSVESSFNTSRKPYALETNVSLSTHTGTTSETAVRSDLLFPRQLTPMFFGNAHHFRLVIIGGKTGSAGNAVLRLRAHTSAAVGGTIISTVTLASGDTGNFKWEVEGQLRPANQRLSNILSRNGVAPALGYNSLGVDMETGDDWYFVVTIELGNSSDSISLPVFITTLTR
jgi:hypothetical protein